MSHILKFKLKEREEEIRLLRKTKQDLQFRVQVKRAAFDVSVSSLRRRVDAVDRWKRRDGSARKMH